MRVSGQRARTGSPPRQGDVHRVGLELVGSGALLELGAAGLDGLTERGEHLVRPASELATRLLIERAEGALDFGERRLAAENLDLGDL
jgi:hypothetical protein